MKIMTVAAAIRNAMSHSSKWSKNFNIMSPRWGESKTYPSLSVFFRRSQSGAERSWNFYFRLIADLLLTQGSGLLVDGGDQVLTDTIGHLRLHRQQGFAPFGLFLVVEAVNSGLAGLLHGGQSGIVFLLGNGVGVLGGILHRTFERGADIRRQAVPELLVDDDGITQIAVIGHRHVLLHFMHLLRVEIGWRILGAVDHAGLQRLVHLGERQH